MLSNKPAGMFEITKQMQPRTSLRRQRRFLRFQALALAGAVLCSVTLSALYVSVALQSRVLTVRLPADTVPRISFSKISGKSVLIRLNNYVHTLEGSSSTTEFCEALGQPLLAVRKEGLPLLLGNSAGSWVTKLQSAVEELKTDPGYRGVTVVCTSNRFLLFNNSTSLQEAIVSNVNESLPCRLVSMSFFQYESHLSGESSPMFHNREFYYFQGPLPDCPDVQEMLTSTPWTCLLGSRTTGEGKVLDVVLQSHGSLRVTPKGSIHALHYDSSGTVLLQIAGQKVVTLIPQEQLPFTYPYPPGHVLARRAQINLTCRYNDVRFPLSQRLTPFQVILNPGDILVIAKHTPHETQSATDAVSLSLRLPF